MRHTATLLLMLFAAAAAAPPPPRPPAHNQGREDMRPHQLPEDGESNTTRAEPPEKYNVTLEMRVLESNHSRNDSVATPFLMLLPLPQEPPKLSVGFRGYQGNCLLPTCATTNLVSDMQGGDEKAGAATSDPYGIGKK